MPASRPPAAVDRDALLFVAPYPPFPLNGGAYIRRHRMLTGLAAEFRTTFVTLESHPGTGRPLVSREELEAQLPGIEVVTLRRAEPFRRAGAIGGRARGILSPRPWELSPFMAPSLANGVRGAARRARAALVHWDFHLIGSPNPVGGRLNVLSTHNVDHRIARANAAHARGRRRIWAELDWRKRRREVRRSWRRVDLCLAVSEIDAREMSAAGAPRVEVLPNGTDPVEMLPPPTRSPGEPVRILFVGTCRYPPYTRGLRWFIEEVLPRVRAELPAAFEVVGVPPEAPVRAPGVSYRGAVPSTRPHYERAHVAVVPFFEGSGTRLKIPEALNYGRPVVSTSVGAEGQPLAPGRHYLEADDPQGFARSIVALARRCEHAERDLMPMLREGREAVAPLTWPNIVRRAVQVHRDEVERRLSDAARGHARSGAAQPLARWGDDHGAQFNPGRSGRPAEPRDPGLARSGGAIGGSGDAT